MRVISDLIDNTGSYTLIAEKAEGELPIRAEIHTGLGISIVKISFANEFTAEGQSKAFAFSNEIRDLILKFVEEKKLAMSSNNG